MYRGGRGFADNVALDSRREGKSAAMRRRMEEMYESVCRGETDHITA